MWGRVEERENFKCLLHKVKKFKIFEYPYQALFKIRCVWSGEYSKTIKAGLWRTAWTPCNSMCLRSWSTCSAFHHPFWARNPRYNAARALLFAVSNWMISVSTNIFFFPHVLAKQFKERLFQTHSSEMWGNTMKLGKTCQISKRKQEPTAQTRKKGHGPLKNLLAVCLVL